MTLGAVEVNDANGGADYSIFTAIGGSRKCRKGWFWSERVKKCVKKFFTYSYDQRNQAMQYIYCNILQ